RDGLRPLAVVAPQIDVYDPPPEPIRDLGAQPVHVVVGPAHPHEAGAVDARADHLRRLELIGDEDPRLESGPCRVRRDGIREVAGRGAADGIQPEGGGRVDRRGHDAILERQRRMGHRVVLHPHPRDAEAPCERRSVDQRREPGVERPHRIAVERQPLLVAPDGWRPGGDGLAVWQRASRLVHGVEGPETLLADRGRGGGALGPAAAATERPGGERRGSDGRRHVSLNKKTPATTAAGGRFLAPCLTWRQYAANHHGGFRLYVHTYREAGGASSRDPPRRPRGNGGCDGENPGGDPGRDRDRGPAVPGAAREPPSLRRDCGGGLGPLAGEALRRGVYVALA